MRNRKPPQVDLRFPDEPERRPARPLLSIVHMSLQTDMFGGLDQGRPDPSVDAALALSNSDYSRVSDEQLDEVCLEMHRVCLFENLSYLRVDQPSKAVFVEQAEVLRWVFSTDVIKGRPASAVPFSFVNCCLAEGVDPETLREQLLQLPLVRALMLDLLAVPLSELPALRRKHFHKEIRKRCGNDDFDNPVQSGRFRINSMWAFQAGLTDRFGTH
jgi:hypothetical protein